jgi:hypothetical protein
MSASVTPAGWTREAAIAVLRERLLRMTDGEHSICKVAADRRIFCRGFRRWNDHEFHARWKATLGVSTHLTRPQMEELADLWQQSEQLAHGIALACDAPVDVRTACRGWEEFTDLEIQTFCSDLTGQAQGRIP